MKRLYLVVVMAAVTVSARAVAQPAPPTSEPSSGVTTYPTMAGSMLRLSELFSIRPGIILQFWGALSQDALAKPDGSSGDFAHNLYVRRLRFNVLGGIGKDVTWFVQLENANLGLATLNADGSVNRNFASPNFIDAWLDYKINPIVSVQSGVFLVPFSRNILQSVTSFWPIDIAAVSATYIAPGQPSNLRDTGAQVKISAADSHLELRGMVSQGVRLPDADGKGRLPGKNEPRVTAYAQYNFFDTETGYVFQGQYFGKKKIAGIALGADYQRISTDNPFFATSATAYAAIPIAGANPRDGGDEIGGQVAYLHYHGGGGAPNATIGKQDDLLVELGYYNKATQLSGFGKFEGRFFAGAGADGNDTRVYGGGAKYFFAEANANVTLQYNLAQTPHVASAIRNSTSQLLLQLQIAYP